MSDEFLENVTFDELTVGRSAALTRALTRQDIELFATVSGDVNPTHLDESYAKNTMFQGVVGHGMWAGTLISTLLGTILPGPGTVYLEQNLLFKRPVRIGDKVTVKVTVASKHRETPIVVLDCVCTNQTGERVLEGTATVLAPTEKIRLARPDLPDVEIYEKDHYRAIIDQSKRYPGVKTAIVQPVQGNVLTAVADAVREGMIIPVLVGPEARIKAAAEEAQIDISNWEIVDAEHSHAAATKAVQMAVHGQVHCLMKGSLHSDELLAAVVPSAAGLRTERRISHAFVMATPTYHKPFIITDAAINIAPGLEEKADICQNSINLWRALFPDMGNPKVAILAAVETVTSKMAATLDAAALCKMSDRGQIRNGCLDGPLAFDNAISKQAAIDKGIRSDVAGDADILLVPNIEAGNVLAKQLSFLGHADAAGIVLGARVPIILTSRADSLRARLLSCALAVIISEARRQGRFS